MWGLTLVKPLTRALVLIHTVLPLLHSVFTNVELLGCVLLLTAGMGLGLGLGAGGV